MKRHSLLVICFIKSILPFHICASEVYDVNISQVIIQKGLSQNTVRTVAVDGDGFIYKDTTTTDIYTRTYTLSLHDALPI